MKHRRNNKKEREMQKDNVNGKGIVKGEPGTYLFWRMEVGNSCG